MPRQPAEPYGALIRDMRLSAGLSQRDLATRLIGRPVEGGNVSKYETGTKQPSLRMLARVAEACGYRLHLQVWGDTGVEYSLSVTASQFDDGRSVL